MRCSIFLSLAGLSQALFDLDAVKLKKAAELILVKGLHTSRQNSGWLGTTANVLQGLNVQITTPGIAFFPADGSTNADSCFRQWRCDVKTFDLCPGEKLTSAEVMEKPVLSWAADPNHFYSIFLVDLFSPVHAQLAGRPSDSIAAKINWAVLNIKGTTDVTQGKEIKPWERPKNPFMEPAMFVFLLFVHGKEIESAWATSALAQTTAEPTKVDLFKFISAMGLTGQHLTGFSFFRVTGSAFTHSAKELARDPNLCTNLLAGQPQNGQLDMCNSKIEKVCNQWTIPKPAEKPVEPVTPVTPPIATGSSPPNEAAAILAGRLKAQIAAQRVAGGKLGRLFEADSALSFCGGAVVGAVLVASVLAVTVWSRQAPSQAALLEE